MGFTNIFPQGLGGTGPAIASLTDDFLSGVVYWVDTVNGSNANAGTQRELPLATLAQAHSNASSGDTIVIEANSRETLTGSITFNKADIYVIGLGSGASAPRYTANGAIDMFNVTAAGVKFENIYFPASTAVATSRVKAAAAETLVKSCVFESGANDTNPAMLVAASGNSCRVSGSTFKSIASRPSIGLSIAATVTDLHVEDTTFDGGTFGWSDYAWKISAAATRIFAQNVSITRKSDFGITAAGTTFRMFGVSSDGSSQVAITS